MRNNKVILDDAARSVRRTFIGSVAGSAVMLGVVGAAGAYGMPEKLTAQAFSAAMAKFNVKFPPKAEHAAMDAEQPVRLASNAKIMTLSPVTDAVDDDAVVVAVPKNEPAPAVAPMAAPALVPEVPVVTAPPLAEVKPVTKPAPASNPFANRDPAPAITASLAPVTLPPAAVEERPSVAAPMLSAPMIFEAPKAADAQVLRELSKTETIVDRTRPVVAQPEVAKPVMKPEAVKAEPQKFEPVPPEQPKPVKPAVVEAPRSAPAPVAEVPLPAAKPVAASAGMQAHAMAVDAVPPAEFPQTVNIRLPVAKPPMSPAQRLDLAGKEYDKAEKCLAQAIYFEARNEPARGQQAVAQVVLNRVFSPHYPKDVCSVVYQNAHRHLSCQFTFACDGKPEAITDRGSWTRANRIATQILNAKVWLPEVNKATHYHAAYVRPNWIRDMNVMVRHGLHTFYRPRNWGDGSNEAHWETPANSLKPPAAQAVKPLTPAQKRFSYRRT